MLFLVDVYSLELFSCISSILFLFTQQELKRQSINTKIFISRNNITHTHTHSVFNIFPSRVDYLPSTQRETRQEMGRVIYIRSQDK